jgi:hypothetical protein
MKTAEEQFPELDTIAYKLFEGVVKKINAINPNQIESTCPYIRQCVLEMVINKLESVV